MAIENVSDTARWVAFYRAMETRRKDPIFRDPYAAQLAGERGAHIATEMPRGRDAAWSMTVRTALIDEIVRDAVASGADLVVNLAAGLDARPWRLDLRRSLRWVDVDLPEILHYKTEMLAGETPRVAYQAIEADLRDARVRQALLSQLGASAARVLVLSEGLLVYLTPEQVGALARDLRAQPSVRWWAFDLLSPQVVRVLEKSWGKTLQAGNARFQFAPPEGTAFFAPFGWRESQYRSMMVEARRLGREMPKAWLWRLIARLAPAARREAMQRMSGVAVLEPV
jgi:methyltransferase (TIGR00027 family)